MKKINDTKKMLSLMALIGAVTSNTVTFMLVQNKRCEADRAALLGEDDITKRNGKAQQKQWELISVFRWIGAFCTDSIAGYYFWRNWILK